MQRVITLDNSPTLFNPDLNEHYHSVNGAVSESMHVFIKNGLGYMRSHRKALSILEVGMGTGLNICLTLKHAGNSEISYIALEPFPLNESVWKGLNYDAWVHRNMFEAVHELEWGLASRIASPLWGTKGVTTHKAVHSLKKLKTTIQNFQPEETFDLIYYDAFAPQVQPELWTEDIFSKIFNITNEGGALVTYCAKGSVKRALSASGFAVESLPGAPGKREMVRAVKRKR